MPLLLLCFWTFAQQAIANPPRTDQAATVTDASLDHPRILNIIKVGPRIILKDDTNSSWCFQIEPLSLLWTKPGHPNSEGTSDESLPTWRIDEVLTQSALNQGIEQATLMALTQGQPPLPAPPSEYRAEAAVEPFPPRSMDKPPENPGVPLDKTLGKSYRKMSKQPLFSKRLGLCLGLDPSCILIGAKFEMTSRFLGVQVAGPLPQFSMKIYPFPVRFYLHAGTALGAGLVENHGGGIGYDIHVLKSRRLIWQPQIGYQYIWVALSGDGIEPSASLSLSYAFGRSPAWVK